MVDEDSSETGVEHLALQPNVTRYRGGVSLLLEDRAVPAWAVVTKHIDSGSTQIIWVARIRLYTKTILRVSAMI